MTIIVVVTTILTLLALLAVPKVNAQKPVHFHYSLFDEKSGNTLIVLNNASIDNWDHVLKLTDTRYKWCTNYCAGQILYSTAIEFIGKNLEKTSSFSSSFVFSMRARSNLAPSDGLLFFLTATNPYDLPRSGRYNYYGVFPLTGQTDMPTIAVEFDTVEDREVDDIDDNHVGVDLNQAKSVSQESCNSQNISLISGDKIKTWIEYHDPVKTLEIRLAYWDPDVVRPAYPLLTKSLDLTTLVKPVMYVGFASKATRGALQKCAIYSWSFHSMHESRAPSKRSKIVAGSCVGVLAVIVALAACFCLGPYRHKKSTEAAKAQKGTTPLSEQDIRVDFPVHASPREDTGVAASPAQGYSGDGRGDDAGSGLSDIEVYQDPSSPSSFSVESTAIQRTMSSDSGHNTRELQVVLKKSETPSHKNRKVTSFVRSQVSSTQRSPQDSPHASPLAGDAIMYTNTLYDSSPSESRGIQPRQRPLFPGSHERSRRAAG